MFRNDKTLVAALIALAATAACSGDGPDRQIVTGTLALSGFPARVTAVRAHGQDGANVRVPVGEDGRFTLALPRGRNYRIDFSAGDRAARLVFPRKTGSLDMTFDVRGVGPALDLGAVRYLGDPDRRRFVFAKQAEAPAKGCAAIGETKEGGEVEEICVDDPAGESGVGGVCEGGGAVGETGAGGEGAGNAIEEEPAGDQQGVGEGTTNVSEAAVAEHNLPDAIGECGGETGPTGADESGGQGVGGTNAGK